MKLLFIENRYKTFLFETIAEVLSKHGFEIYWLIQNKAFLPSKAFKTYIIKYPKKLKEDYQRNGYVENIIKSDRQINYFKKNDTSYFYYYDYEIQKILKEVAPDIVFGESTAFHELLTIENCKKLNILYLNPSTCRYPIGRFSFYKYDTLEPYLGSGELLSNVEAELTIDQIVNRKTAPDYMKPIPVSKKSIFKDKFKKTVGYFTGEKYNTPNPLVKYKLEKNRDKIITSWDIEAEKKIVADNDFKILYPLQMQPEANIDVWGKKYRNQEELIRRISHVIPENSILYVKPNPKSKYELSRELLELVKDAPNIKYLHHAAKMDEVLPHMNLVVTVTGTIAIECILSNKPVVTLVKTINNQSNNCRYLQELNELPNIITQVRNNCFEILTIQEKIHFVNVLNKSSYKGIISDPFSDYNCVSPNNVDNVLIAFEDILENIK